MAKRYPKSHILTVSNSRSQKKYIDTEAVRRGLTNLQVITADMNEFTTERRFDRIVSVEMFEHMRNYPELMRRIASWSRPGALLFVHIFAHQSFAYPYEVRDANDWMAEHFFTGGVMPSDELLLYFQDSFRIREHWRFSGDQYQKTSEAWLERLERHKPEILAIFAAVYGKDQARSWLERWRVFFMACAEMFGYESGNQWIVSHYLFESRPVSNSQGTLA
jgi:cyclopropane-fatty-acyl-phospholipid synthase